MSLKKTYFSDSWLEMPRYQNWLGRSKQKDSFYCVLCRSDRSLSNMGEQALKHHMKGVKHLKLMKCVRTNPPIHTYLTAAVASSSNNDSMQVPVINQCNNSLDVFLEKENVRHAEILWCLNMIETHLSYRVAAKTASILTLMFPNCETAKQLQIQRTKLSYMTVFGIAPYFKEQLRKRICNSQFFTVLFDESLNKISQRGQMDVFVRFWTDNRVQTRYLTSGFLGHANATELLKCLLSCLAGFDLKKMIHVSMDGPNVNWALLKLIKEYLVDTNNNNSPIPLEFGSCALHVVHGAFKTSNIKVGWGINKFLSALYYLFKDSPARRADFLHYNRTNCGKVSFPLKFCSVRWLENTNVAERAIAIIPEIKQYVSGLLKDKVKVSSNSFAVVQQALEDPLLSAKLGFFQSISLELEEFLTRYQGDAPLVPFMHDHLLYQLRSLMNRFVKKNIMLEKVSAKELVKLNLDDSSNLKPPAEIDIGFSARDGIKKQNSVKTLTTIQIVKFRTDCQVFLVTLVKKLQERSPLKYNFIKGISCLSPTTSQHCRAPRMKIVLDNLVQNNRLSGANADALFREYNEFISSSSTIEKMKLFSSKDRLDELYFSLLKEEKSSKNLSDLIFQLLTLSHGQATVERGFSINKECLIENLLEESLVAQRIIYDHISEVGGTKNVNIDKALTTFASGASHRYKMNLQEKKLDAEKQNHKRIAELTKNNMLKELSEKRRKIELETQSKLAEIDEEIKLLN